MEAFLEKNNCGPVYQSIYHRGTLASGCEQDNAHSRPNRSTVRCAIINRNRIIKRNNIIIRLERRHCKLYIIVVRVVNNAAIQTTSRSVGRVYAGQRLAGADPKIPMEGHDCKTDYKTCRTVSKTGETKYQLSRFRKVNAVRLRFGGNSDCHVAEKFYELKTLRPDVPMVGKLRRKS